MGAEVASNPLTYVHHDCRRTKMRKQGSLGRFDGHLFSCRPHHGHRPIHCWRLPRMLWCGLLGHSCHGNCDDVCGTYTNSQGEICLEPTGGAVTPGAWWALLIIGIIFLILGCVFSCCACNCCCFKGDGAPAADEMDDVVEAEEDAKESA